MKEDSKLRMKAPIEESSPAPSKQSQSQQQQSQQSSQQPQSKENPTQEVIIAEIPKAHPHPLSSKEELQGIRPTMEDASVHIDSVTVDSFATLPRELDNNISYFGVYDGHGGIEASKWCEAHLHENIFRFLDQQKREDNFQFDFSDAFQKAFRFTDQQIIQASIQPEEEQQGDASPKKGKQFVFKCGTTVGVAIVYQQRIFVANVGDTEIVLSKLNSSDGTYEPILLTKKHMVNIPEEKERIQKQGGIVIHGRLYGDLIVSRSLGDPQYKAPHCGFDGDLISPMPHIFSIPLNPLEHEFLILACDGLWDVIKYKQAVDLVAKWKKEGKQPNEISSLLAKEALNLRSQDNVTVIVVFFNWEIIK